jgi:hypothetical protein
MNNYSGEGINIKRFTDIDKWKRKWFRTLPLESKVLFEYLRDNCDNAGFIEIDEEIISLYTGISIRGLEGAFKGLNGSFIQNGNMVWIKNFLFHQKNLPLNINNNAHKQIINLIQFNLKLFPEIPNLLGAQEGLFSPPGKGKGKGNGKGNGKKKFIKPTIEQIRQYCDENNINIDPETFFHSNETKGWVVGKTKTPMKNWKSTIQTWVKNNYANTKTQKGPQLPPGKDRIDSL